MHTKSKATSHEVVWHIGSAKRLVLSGKSLGALKQLQHHRYAQYVHETRSQWTSVCINHLWFCTHLLPTFIINGQNTVDSKQQCTTVLCGLICTVHVLNMHPCNHNNNQAIKRWQKNDEYLWWLCWEVLLSCLFSPPVSVKYLPTQRGIVPSISAWCSWKNILLKNRACRQATKENVKMERKVRQ